MPSSSRTPFLTIRAEGALLPVDLLQRIVENDHDLGGLSPESYHLSGEKLNEAINRSWNRLLGAWAAFSVAREKLPEGDPGTSVTREKWSLPLFDELDYGRLQITKAIDIEGKSYAISHGWNEVPIHLVGCGARLDTRTSGVVGAAKASPHSLVQELLNRSPERTWGFVSNGLRMRALRDNASLTRQAYLEFDLEAMMNGEVYADFVVLWLVCHQSRVETAQRQETLESCWLEKWSKAAQERGTHALEGLRVGVQKAIEALGQGFIAHPANSQVRSALTSGVVSTLDLYRQLLRLVYRLIFLFVAEDRQLLYDPASDAESRKRYADYYSTARLRRMAERVRGGRHADLYAALKLVMEKLGDGGAPELGLPALGGFLFSREAVRSLVDCEIANVHLLEAIRSLAFTQTARTRRAVDYKNLGVRELGSVYESLLELHPVINASAGTFELVSVAGSERKTTGSFFTAEEVIALLLDSALNPVIEQALLRAGNSIEKQILAILNLKICDPACGSGHFLIAAARRLARRLAQLRTGEGEPAPEAMRAAMREVISQCIYGVDINPMSVELCKVSLWMEALEPGKPLSFLDAHIQCGDSLVGVSPNLDISEIPDEAFNPAFGDDKATASTLKKRNKRERGGSHADKAGQLGFRFEVTHLTSLDDLARWLAERAEQVDAMPEDDSTQVQAKAKAFDDYHATSEYLKNRFELDLWTASFFWNIPKADAESMLAPTQQELIQLRNGVGLDSRLVERVKELSERLNFFHWELAFPKVFSGENPGFDCVLGNPPWDTLSPDAKEFFSVFNPSIRSEDQSGQDRIINELLQDSTISEQWNDYCQRIYQQATFCKTSGRYKLFAPGNLGKGDFNIFRLFIELGLQTTREGGWLSQVVPEGLYNGANSMAIRKELFETCKLDFILGFANSSGNWFPGVHRSQKFSMYSATKGGSTSSFNTAFNIQSQQALSAVRAGKSLNMPVELVREFSPDALAIMEFSEQIDIDISTKAYRQWQNFGDETDGKVFRHYMREVDMGNDRDLFNQDGDGIPVYEGRMVDQYDYRAKAYQSGHGRTADWVELDFDNPDKSIQPQWYISEEQIPDKARERISKYRIGFCDVTSPTNERTLLTTLIPPNCICGHKVPTIAFSEENEWYYPIWIAIANSFVVDFIVRKKVSLSMSYTILDSIPFPRLEINDSRVGNIMPMALKLICTGQEMLDYWNYCAKFGWVDEVISQVDLPSFTNYEERLISRCKIEAIIARDLFSLSKQEMDYILDAFPIVKKRDKARFGEYRTRQLVLDAWDKID